MNGIDVNELKARKGDLEQRYTETWAFIVSELRAFPMKAQVMNVTVDMFKFVFYKNPRKTKSTVIKRPCFRLAKVCSRHLNENGEYENPLRFFIVVGEDGTCCFANNKLSATSSERIFTNPEDFASHLMENFAEFRNVESAKRILESALSNAPENIVCSRWARLGQIQGDNSSNDSPKKNSARKAVWPKVVIFILVAIAFLFCVRRLANRDKTPPSGSGQTIINYDDVTLPPGDPPWATLPEDHYQNNFRPEDTLPAEGSVHLIPGSGPAY